MQKYTQQSKGQEFKLCEMMNFFPPRSFCYLITLACPESSHLQLDVGRLFFYIQEKMFPNRLMGPK